jgi:hypothetical protein
MATTLTVAQTMAWAQAFGLGRVLNAYLNNEPALTSANMVLMTIIAPPFTWNWNRSSVSFLTTANVQDYTQAVSTYGNIEKVSYVPAATITNVVGSGTVATITAANAFIVGNLVTITGLAHTAFNVTNAVITSATATQFTFASVTSQSTTADSGTAVSGSMAEITNVVNVLGAGAEIGTPNSFAPQVDDNAGNITFRILPVPDATYQITVVFQKAIPAIISSTSTTWAPVPDKYAYVYEWGFLALMAAYFQDSKWASYNQKFVAALLGIAEGIEEDQKNIFQKAWLNSMTEVQLAGSKEQQGTQAHGV